MQRRSSRFGAQMLVIKGRMSGGIVTHLWDHTSTGSMHNASTHAALECESQLLQSQTQAGHNRVMFFLWKPMGRHL